MSESNRVESNLSPFGSNRTLFGPIRFDQIEQPLGSTRFDSIGALGMDGIETTTGSTESSLPALITLINPKELKDISMEKLAAVNFTVSQNIGARDFWRRHPGRK